MKLRELLLIACWLILVQSEDTKTVDLDLLRRASAQLERLSSYRRPIDLETSNSFFDEKVGKSHETAAAAAVVPEVPTVPPAPSIDPNLYDEQRMGLEILQILPQDMQKELLTTNKIDEDRLMMDVLTNPKYSQMLQDRIKRSGGGLIGNIAGGIIGGFASASGQASKGSSGGSSGGYHDSYHPHGHVGSYGHKTFDIWDFKKAIINTLFQAVKAVSGGVLALKGQLIKGGGFLVSTKGRIISTTGDAITSLGKHIASSAILHPPSHHYAHHGYSYEAPHTEHDSGYESPPPETYGSPHDSYDHHSSYASPSDDDHAGLLIVKATKPHEEVADHHSEHHPEHHTEHHLEHHPDDHSEHHSEDHTEYHSGSSHLADLEDSFGGPPKGEHPKEVVNNLGPSSTHHEANDHLHHEEHSEPYPPLGTPPPDPPHLYDYSSHDDKGTYVDHPPKEYSHPHKVESHLYPPTDNHIAIQQSAEYPPTLHQYGSPHVDTLKIPILGPHQEYTLPKLEAMDFFKGSLYGFKNGYNQYGGYQSLQHPPVSAEYWNNGIHPNAYYGGYGSPGLSRRRSLQRRLYAYYLRRPPAVGLKTSRFRQHL
ncbi:uncharacterized protein [Prorops nasuta]|uniref:uncharacterized protein n=1 Tax=Prorops nasuta TaxID=863751 RepID=UPI0034CE35C0